MSKAPHLPDVPIGTVVRIKGIRGPWRHLGHGFLIQHNDPTWQQWLLNVQETHTLWDEVLAMVDEKIAYSNAREYIDVYQSWWNLSEHLKDQGIWMDPRCFKQDFSIVKAQGL